MTRDAYKDEIRLKMTGGILELEIDDATLDKIINAAFREIQRYICTPLFKTISFSKCINLQELNIGRINSIQRVFRTCGVSSVAQETDDPMVISQWQMIGGLGNLYNFQDSMDNYLAWNTLLRLRNTTSTDLAYTFDEHDQKLYINVSTNIPSDITIMYIPQYEDVEQITDDYWIDNLVQMSVALTKIALGRIRSRYTQSNALWQQDGDKILQEGLEEYKSLQEYLRQNSALYGAVD